MLAMLVFNIIETTNNFDHYLRTKILEILLRSCCCLICFEFISVITMASCVFRSLVKPQVFRYLSRTTAPIKVVNSQSRRIHSTPIVLKKYFTEKHEWVDVDDSCSSGTVGITDYAQDKLGEVVFVQLPEIGQTLEIDGEAGVLESVKAASDIYSPVSGEVTEVNQFVADNPITINQSPLESGWLFKMTLSNPSELEGLMTEESYSEFLKDVD